MSITLVLVLSVVFLGAAGLVAAGVAAAAVLLLRPRPVSAHCDTMDGPAVRDGLLALETGNVNIALKWVPAANSDELSRIFAEVQAARRLGPDAALVAVQWFLENLVRIHRAGEGAPYTGIQPPGTPIDERVRAADAAVATGDLGPLTGLMPPEQLDELQARFAEVLARQDFPDDDVDAGRDYLDAYVRFFKLAEGHDHGEHDHGGHEHAYQPHCLHHG